jgi:hypothetical protein
MNLRDFKDATMVDQNGVSMIFNSGWFVRNCMNHPGILEDNIRGTIASAAHFKKFPQVVSFQIYNEPAYPSKGFYDYHPFSIAAYRDWLVGQGFANREEADKLDPPRKRPLPGEDPTPWIRFREFNKERLTNFLLEMSRRAHEGYNTPETLTCQMPCPVSPGSAIRGEDYYEIAKGMDVVGITHYIPCRGPSFHNACLALDAAESAAAAFCKHAWIIEYNARTIMPPQEWDRETYAALGRGYKGILYYQWRADYPFPDGPEPDEFGMIFNDGRKAPCHDAGVAMTKLVNRLSPWLARAEKLRNGLAILYSSHANAYFDAVDNGTGDGIEDAHDRFVLAMRRCYQSLNRQGVTVDFLRAEDLQTSKFRINTLIVPMRSGLSDDELNQIDAFAKNGNKVFYYQDDQDAFLPYDNAGPALHGIVRPQYSTESLLTVLKLEVHAVVEGAPACEARLLTGRRDGNPFGVVCLTNYDTLERPVKNAVLRLQGFNFKRAAAYAPDLQDAGLTLKDGGILLPELTTGAFIILE